MCFIVASLCVLTTNVTVCVCHAELKCYLLNYLLQVCHGAYLEPANASSCDKLTVIDLDSLENST